MPRDPGKHLLPRILEQRRFVEDERGRTMNCFVSKVPAAIDAADVRNTRLLGECVRGDKSRVF
jgi:hypothetical protein